eukprot:TRINITY_DN6623_c0_g2_i10.p1 TRINITY_DN6623_c0_g2~~TRINITY_DN6623_c0_g2_i10.p1  ORF type:complete len:382 (+),score=93.17 TRINITY_DN6623_c0_g2_i10:2-1147(+)
MNVSTMKELKGKLNSLNAELFDDVAFREFYKFMFDYAKGEGSSGINAEYGECSTIPIIDVSPLFGNDAFSPPYSDRLLNLISQVDAASSQWGFYNIIHHGIDDDLIQRVQELMKQFFSVDNIEQKKYCTKPSAQMDRGYSKTELTKNVLDWKELFDFGIWGESMEEDNLWPKNNPMFRETMTEYFLKMLNLARSLNRVNALALGQNSDFFDSFFEDNNFPSIVRLNYYPPTGSDKLVLGVNPHQDGGCLTILKIDDEVSGLQVYKGITSEFQVESSDWVTVDPVPGALVVNVGMMLEVWSNMKYKAALHRVVANNVKPRYSAPFFHFPSYSSTIQPILDAPNDLPKYRPIQYGEFRRLLFEGFSKPIPFEQQARLPNFRIN